MAPPDTGTAPPDTATAPPHTATAPPHTATAPPYTATAPRRTHVPPRTATATFTPMDDGPTWPASTSSTATWAPPTTTPITVTWTPPTTTLPRTTTTIRPITHDPPITRPTPHDPPIPRPIPDDPPIPRPPVITTKPDVIPPITVPNRTITGPGIPTFNPGSITSTPSITLGPAPTGIKTTDDGGLPKAAVIGIGVTAALIVGFVVTVMVYKTRHRHKALDQDDLFGHLPIESPKPPPPPMDNIHHLSGHYAVGHQAHHNHNHNSHHHHETDNLYDNSEYHHHNHYGDQDFNHHGDHQGYDHHYDGDQGTSQHHPGDFNQAPNQDGHGAGGNQGFSGGDGGQGFSDNQGFSDGQGYGNQGFGGNQGGGLDQLGSTHNQTGFEGHHGFDGQQGFDGHQGFDQGGPSSGQDQGFGNDPSGGQGFSNGPSGAQPQGFTPTNQSFGPGPSQPTGNIGGTGIGSTSINTGINFGYVVSTPPPPAGPILDYKKPPPLAPRPDSTITSPTLTAGLDHRASISSVTSSGILQSWDGDSSSTPMNTGYSTGYSPQSKQNLLAQFQAANYSQDLNYVRPPPANASSRVLVSPTIATIPQAVKPVVRAPQDRTSSDVVGAITSTGNVSNMNTYDRRHPQLKGEGHHESMF
ncbi:hypothetical protein BGZ81_007572 [Podila clonocystis]|nr:hypothetical protein BGZ81_007572 [Podila clonocystis]